jgi:ketosteroid isomerase-like protein
LPDTDSQGKARYCDLVSQQNLDLVRRIYEGWSRGDFSVGADLLAPDFEWRQHAEAVEPGSHRGEKIGGALKKIFEIYENFRIEPEEYIDADDRVIVVGRSRGTARGSGLEVDQPFAWVWTVRGGHLVRLEVYSAREQALAAAGLRS